MRIQNDNFSCGACAILNALDALGIEVGLAQVERIAGTTKQGTDEVGIKEALDSLGLACQAVSWTDDRPLAVRGDWFFTSILRGASAGDPAIVYSKPKEHWFAVVGALGGRLVVWDSDNSPENIAENGSKTYDKDRLLEDTGSELYALRVISPSSGRIS